VDPQRSTEPRLRNIDLSYSDSISTCGFNFQLCIFTQCISMGLLLSSEWYNTHWTYNVTLWRVLAILMPPGCAKSLKLFHRRDRFWLFNVARINKPNMCLGPHGMWPIFLPILTKFWFLDRCSWKSQTYNCTKIGHMRTDRQTNLILVPVVASMGTRLKSNCSLKQH
jgi:hypothetical protein